MFLSIVLFFLIISGSAFSSDVLQSSYGVKVGVIKSKLTVSYSDHPLFYEKYDFPRIGPIIGVFYRNSLKTLPFDATLSYSQEGGVDKMYFTTVEQPNGTGEYAKIDTQYDLIDFSVTARPGKKFGKVLFSAVGGGCVSYVLSVNGVFTESESYKKYVIASIYGVELRYLDDRKWVPFIEILVRDEITDIYDRSFNLLQDSDDYNVNHNIKSVIVQLGFELN